jgi:UDP-N-acetyl-D-mannosaminuronic acid transferase (WecB/TagA/CpsF family)
MKNITINIVNTVGDSFCVEADDGQKVYELIKKALADDRKVTLSFLNVEMLTTAFLNTAVGQLYRDFSEEIIKKSLSVENLSDSGAVSLKRVVDTAKLYYKDPEAMQRSINDIMGE